MISGTYRNRRAEGVSPLLHINRGLTPSARQRRSILTAVA